MNRQNGFDGFKRRSVPRVRGDEPAAMVMITTNTACSPRPRG